MKRDVDSANVRIPPPFVFLFGLVAGWLIRWLSHIGGFGIDAKPRVAIGLLIAFAGVVLVVSAARLFRRLGTNVEPWTTSTLLVSSGPYRWTRNPMYVGMTLLYLGLAVALDTIFALILLPIVLLVIRTQVIAREERYLEAKFGDDYRAYKKRVRRWI